MEGYSFFSHDLQQEQLLGAFLDHEYVRLGMLAERVQDLEMQNQGIDLLVSRNGKHFLVDEKAQLDYVGRSIPTFAFEIGFFKGAEHRPGWLFDERKLTTHYMLVTDIVLHVGGKIAFAENIASVSLLWLNRERLKDYLTINGFDLASCQKAEDDARKGGLSGKIPTGIKGMYFFLSAQKAERPFNLVVSRENLLHVGAELISKGNIVIK